jgi:hypothetical protein
MRIRAPYVGFRPDFNLMRLRFPPNFSKVVSVLIHATSFLRPFSSLELRGFCRIFHKNLCSISSSSVESEVNFALFLNLFVCNTTHFCSGPFRSPFGKPLEHTMSVGPSVLSKSLAQCTSDNLMKMHWTKLGRVFIQIHRAQFEILETLHRNGTDGLFAVCYPLPSLCTYLLFIRVVVPHIICSRTRSAHCHSRTSDCESDHVLVLLDKCDLFG